MIKQIGLPLRGRPILLINRVITDRIGLHSVLLPLLIHFHFAKYSTMHDYPSDNLLTYRHLEQAPRLIFISVHMMFFWLVLQVSPSLSLKIKFTKQFTLLFTESFSKIFFKKLINPSILLVSAVHSLQPYVPW